MTMFGEPIEAPEALATADDFACVLSPLEVEALGDLSGKRVLHLLAGTPVESFALADLGARVLAARAAGDEEALMLPHDLVEAGNALATESGAPVRFSDATVAEMADSERDDGFDVVYAGPLTLATMEDIEGWAVDVSEALHRGGTVVVFDDHPAAWAHAAEAIVPGQLDVDEDEVEEMNVDGWSLDDLVAQLATHGLEVTTLAELHGPQRFLTTAETIEGEYAGPSAFLLVAHRPGAAPR